MKLLWHYLERWLPAATAVLAVLGVCLVGWTQGERIAALEGGRDSIRQELDRRAQLEAALRMEVQTLQAHVVVLHRELIRAGVDVPPLPGETNEQRRGN